MADPDDAAGFVALKEPVDCILWTQPALVEDKSAKLFDRLNTFEDGSHLTRHLLKCRECGHLYFYEFFESIDWDEGDDPQCWTYIPVETPSEIEQLKKTPPMELMRFTPRLLRDFPRGARSSRLGWIK